ncbi:MAG: TrpB-like pyridoxal phosphate-dependent enzyme [Microthrixaceae bacterium]|nr:TrpB-like pyridoxal phosphate-dependent enzyme [Microthrixaceae bacterium]
MSETSRYTLSDDEMPTSWYNIIPDLPEPPPPPLHPGTHEPIGPDDLAPLFPMDLIAQEVSTDRHIPIPDEVIDVYRLWRATPLHRAHRLERALGTPARIYYKYEGVSPAGSHKPNTAVPQAYYNAKAGVKRLTTETGAGQWGTALAFAAAQFGLQCEVWQVRASYDQKPYRRAMMQAFGATVHPSPSDVTEFGRKLLAETPDTPGSLGIAISEAVEVAAGDPDTRYALGSVLNHVLLHQTVIGEEALLQMAKAGDSPDVIIGCTGGGSNFGGLAFPFLREKLAGNIDVTIRAVEPASCPSLTKGTYTYDFGDTAGMTPAGEDAHARARLHPGPDPCRRSALPRHEPAAVAHLRTGSDRRPRPFPRPTASRPACSSPAPRASCPHPSRPTRWRRRCRRPCAARRPVRRR